MMTKISIYDTEMTHHSRTLLYDIMIRTSFLWIVRYSILIVVSLFMEITGQVLMAP